MNYEELKILIKRSGLTINEFAKILGYSPASISNLAKQDVVPNNLIIIASLMAELEYHEIDFKKIINKLDLKSHGNKKV